MSDDHFGTREEMIDRYRAEQKAHNACYERAHMLEREVAALRGAAEPALRYIQHVGANYTERGEPHPQQWIVDKLTAALSPCHAQEPSKD